MDLTSMTGRYGSSGLFGSSGRPNLFGFFDRSGSSGSSGQINLVG